MTLARASGRGRLIFGAYAVLFALAAATDLLGLAPLLSFAFSTAALAGGALAVGEATERLSSRLSPAATGVVQSVLGNLPELFLGVFALQAGLMGVVAAALIGSVLGNALFVLGIALVVGGLRHGSLRFAGEANRLLAVQLLLGVAALIVPFLAVQPGAPDVGHETSLSVVVALVLLAVFAFSVPAAVRTASRGAGTKPPVEPEHVLRHPLGRTLVILALAAGSSAFVADWFVQALRPAMASLGMSEAFAGLIVVALAGNAVENLAGVTAAWRGRADLALSLILNSALQVVLFLAPILVLLSLFVAPAPMTLILSPLLLGALAVSAVLVFAIVLDGDANALEGAALVGLYVIVGAAVWWGPRIGA
ncbi:MAG TPA: sodium:proton exchanger [Candidatus Dormibacteraeota bacterium]|nr:sodium:proton exchanger [Candidatus Dormibacteraeota bacterium]